MIFFFRIKNSIKCNFKHAIIITMYMINIRNLIKTMNRMAKWLFLLTECFVYASKFIISNSSFCFSRSKFSISKSNFLLSFVRTIKCISLILSSVVSLFLFWLAGAFCDDPTVKIWCFGWGLVTSKTGSCICTREESTPPSSGTCGKEHCSCGSVALPISGSAKIKIVSCAVLVEGFESVSGTIK